MRKTFFALVAIALATTVMAQSPSRPQILVLGTYHMESPGRDLFNSKVDDVLAPRRQSEIAALVDVLKKFKPTKIAIEANVNSRGAKREYREYLAGKYILTANEIDQIGYRIAREMGDTTIYPVDEDGDFPFYRVRNYALANGRKEAFEAAQAVTAARVKAQDEYLSSHTILEHLLFLNSDFASAKGVGEYYTSYVPFGEPWEYAGADLIASWFQRNLRIYTNIRALAQSPNDRILVIYGYGHLGWLRQIVASDPTVQLRTLSEFAPKR